MLEDCNEMICVLERMYLSNESIYLMKKFSKELPFTMGNGNRNYFNNIFFGFIDTVLSFDFDYRIVR